MIAIALMTFLAAFRPCGCLSTCVNADCEGAEDMRLKWEQGGLTVKEMYGYELVKLEWACPVKRAKHHTLETYDMAREE